MVAEEESSPSFLTILNLLLKKAFRVFFCRFFAFKNGIRREIESTKVFLKKKSKNKFYRKKMNQKYRNTEDQYNKYDLEKTCIFIEL